MTWAARLRPSLLWGKIAFGSMFLCSAAALAEEALWKMYFDTGKDAYEQSRYATSETMFVAARKEAEAFGSNDVRLASTLFWLARVYNADKKDEKAELNYRRAIEIWGSARGPASIEFAEALNELAGKLRDQKKYDEAEPLYKRAQDMAEKHFGPDDPHVAAALSTQAENFYDEEKYAEARLLTERAIAILEKNNQPEDLAAPLTFLNNLAGKLRGQKKYGEAEALYKRAQEIAEKHFGPDDPHVAEALSTQADNFCDEEKYAEAEPLYVRALAITEKKQGSEDPSVVNSIRPLALTLFAQKKFDQARLLTERAIAILEKNNEPEDLAAPLTFLGRTCEGLGSYADAERAYKRALDTLGRDNRAALDTLENYSRMLRDLKREPEAKALEARIRKIQATTQAVEEKR